MQFQAEWHAVPPGRVCCFCGIYSLDTSYDKKHNREATTLDMFPTTLAALGVSIEGDRLGMGTNLFSDEETLAEKLGIEKLNEELMYKSKFYEVLFSYIE